MVGPADDVIVAPATPPGRGALAIVRLSGAGAFAIAGQLCGRSSWCPRRATRVRLSLGRGVVDDALVTPFEGPHSFTGEDVVEFSVHGTPVIVEALLRACVERGARLARPGEFSYRAYLTGKLDLLQAEAVDDLVSATTAAQVEVASAHLEGTLSERIRRLGDELASVRALLEASLDFPDEGFHFITPAALEDRLRGVRATCEELLETGSVGQRLREGATVVVTGRPNAGKSSLFNVLLGRPRAIVTAAPGTTRDLLAEPLVCGGVPVTLVDTAGLRHASDVVEREGVSRAREALGSADLALLVINPLGSSEDDEESEATWKSLPPDRRICVVTRRDLEASAEIGPGWWPDDHLRVSTITGQGIEELRRLLGTRLGAACWDGVVLTRARHRAAMTDVSASLARALETVASGGTEEYVLVDVLDGLEALASLRRVETTDQVLETIFGSFCIGK